MDGFTLVRSLHKGDSGPDVLALKRALKKAGEKFAFLMVLNQGFGSGVDRCLRRFQAAHQLTPDGVFGPSTLNKLRPYIDAYGESLFKQAPRKTPEEETFAELLSFMEKMTRDTPGYLLGGGHGPLLNNVKTTDYLDCSSSCSLALHHVRLFPSDYAWDSGTFARAYGNGGTGKLFTIYANADHVWMRLYRGPYWRFDTSPHGDGGFGPRLRKLPRFTSSFVARHQQNY